MRYAWASASHEGLSRDHNEDNIFPRDVGISEDALTVGVADGMGGHVGGEVASRVALDTAMTSDHLSLEERVKAANLAVIDEVIENPRLAGMGTTLTLARFDHEGGLQIAHVGDSRAYLFRDGELRQLTVDHSMIAEMLESGSITAEQAATHPYRSVITRAVGLERSVNVDLIEEGLRPGDRVLLCSDGLSSMISDPGIAGILAAGSPPVDTVWELVDAANQAGGEDNISVLIVDIE